MQFLLAHGPNLNLLGSREPSVYGSLTLAELEALTGETAQELGVGLETFQTNHEGALIDRLHAARGHVDGIILNAGAWTHTSYALRDAIEAIGIPTIELHISNVKEREPFRRTSVLEPVCRYTIYGRGTRGYPDAVRRLHAILTSPVQVHAYGPHPGQLGELRTPSGEGPFPVVTLIHGGFWRHQWTRDTLDRLAMDLVEHGVATWNIEYRRAGVDAQSTGEDVTAALDHLGELGSVVDLDRVALVGHSAGGQLALWLAGRRPHAVRLVVSLAAVTDLSAGRSEGLGDGAVEAFLGDIDPTSWSPRHIVPLGVESLCVHGSSDEQVPPHHSVDFVHAAGQAGDESELMLAEGDDHFSLIDPRTGTWQAVRARVVEALHP